MDNEAALIAELDLVITVQQTAVHLAGGLGVPCWVMVPKNPLWRYGLTGNTMPWYKCARLYRQRGQWLETIAEVATDLRKFCATK
jgi:ADP-heptose:LPS heptosyltransferase